MTRVCWGTIGCGDVCERKSGRPLYQVAGSQLIGVTRRDAAKGRDFAQRHGPCRYYESVAALLAEPAINAIYVATPHGCHKEQTIAAARAGKHVLVEKPMANDAGECREMIAACRQAGVILGVAYYRRCYPSMLRLKELLARIGRPRTIRINAEFPLSHRLDLVHFLFGDFGTVRAAGTTLHAVTGNGVAAIMEIPWRETGAPETVKVVGDTGQIVVDDLKGGSLTGPGGRERLASLPATHWGLVENFVAHVNGAAALACDGGEGRKSSVILDLVSTLTPDGPEVAVDYPRPPRYDAVRAAGLRLLG